MKKKCAHFFKYFFLHLTRTSTEHFIVDANEYMGCGIALLVATPQIELSIQTLIYNRTTHTSTHPVENYHTVCKKFSCAPN